MKPSIFALLVLASLAGCSRADKKTAEQGMSPASSAAAANVVPSATAVAPSPEAGAPAPVAKKHLRVLHTGDSMVGGGLSRALAPKFEAAGAKYQRDVIESGTIHDFSQKDHFPELIASFKPDLILLTLGANHLPNSVDPDKEIGPFLPKLLARMKGIDCIWIAPPIWKPSQAKFNEWLGQRVAPCKFYDASSLDIARRPDKIHPNEKGGEVWADDLWSYMQGPGAFFESSP